MRGEKNQKNINICNIANKTHTIKKGVIGVQKLNFCTCYRLMLNLVFNTLSK